jgi:transketolase
MLAVAGFFPDDELARIRTQGGILQGHPDRKKTSGVDVTTGSLGQGFGVACGIALARRRDPSLGRVYCIVGDGECNEGSIWESALVAANLKITGLTVFVDHNGYSNDGTMRDRNAVDPLADKWRAFGWHVLEIDGHDLGAIEHALDAARDAGAPTAIVAKTIKGKGVSRFERMGIHSGALGADAYPEVVADLTATWTRLHG